MTNFNLIHELEKLHEYLYGAHHATDDDELSAVCHTACHKIDEIINNQKIAIEKFHLDVKEQKQAVEDKIKQYEIQKQRECKKHDWVLHPSGGNVCRLCQVRARDVPCVGGWL